MTDKRDLVPQGGNKETPVQRNDREQAARLKDRVARVVDMIDGRMDEIGPWLRQSSIDPDVFMSSVRLALAKTPKIADCTPISIVLACMDLARLGLPPDGKKAAIVPYKKVATPVPMYQGFLDVIYRTGLVSSATCQVIYEGEDDPAYFDYDIGDDPFVSFKPPIAGRDDKRPIVAAFATAKAKDGVGKWVEVMGQAELRKVARVNKFGDVRSEWPGEMDRKSPLRRMIKFLPSHPLLDVLRAVEAKTYKGAAALKDDTPRLADDELLDDGAAPSASTPQITQGADQVVEVTLEPEDDMDLVPALDRFTNMLATAGDAETLEQRAAMIVATTEYDAMEATEKALVDMTLRQQRVDFGLDPEALTGAAQEGDGEEEAEEKRPILFPLFDKGETRSFATAAEWQAAAMDVMAKRKPEELFFWWKENLAHVQSVAQVSIAHAKRVAGVAASKDLEGAQELHDRLEGV